MGERHCTGCLKPKQEKEKAQTGDWERDRHVGRLVTHKGIAQISGYIEDKGSKALHC